MTAELRDKISELPTPRKSITPRVGNKILHGAKQTKTDPLSNPPEAAISQPDISKTDDLQKNVEAASVVSSAPTEKRTTSLPGKSTVLRKSLQSRSQAVANLKLKAQANQRLKTAKEEKLKNSRVTAVNPQNCFNVGAGANNQHGDNLERILAKETPGEPSKREAVNANNEKADTESVSTASNIVTVGTVPETGKASKDSVKKELPPAEAQEKQSIRRSKTTIVPISYHVPTFNKATKLALRSKSKNSIVQKQPQAVRYKTNESKSRKSLVRRKGDRVPNDETVQILRIEPNVARASDKTLEIKIGEGSEDYESTSTESLDIIDSVGHPSCQTLSKNLERVCKCRSHTDCSHDTSSQIESWSESRHYPEAKNIKKLSKLSKHRRYLQTTSDESDLSDYSGKRIKVRKKNVQSVHNVRSSLQPIHRSAPATKSNLPVSTSAKVRRRQSNFSFFNALFDIVFWPFVFLRTDR